MIWLLLVCTAIANPANQTANAQDAKEQAKCVADVTLNPDGTAKEVVVETNNVDCPPDFQTKAEQALKIRPWPPTKDGKPTTQSVEYVFVATTAEPPTTCFKPPSTRKTSSTLRPRTLVQKTMVMLAWS